MAKKHRKQLAKKKGSDLPLLDLMLQGGLYHGSQTGFEPCPLCSTDDGLFHRPWQCPAMLRHIGNVPPEWAPHVDETEFWRKAFLRFLGAKSALAHSTFKVLASGPM